jgi:hypothetical protein
VKLFSLGAVVGPIVDSLHNQCLLEYHVAPIIIDAPFSIDAHLLASSWLVPPLLGIAYVILGGILPRVAQAGIDRAIRKATTMSHQQEQSFQSIQIDKDSSKHFKFFPEFIKGASTTTSLNERAIIAVLTTALIIRLSSVLETTSYSHAEPILILLVLCQWIALDGTLAALLVAAAASIGGPLSELPFVANHVWTYLPAAADYFPLQGIEDDSVFRYILGEGFQSLSLAKITGPCYFAVTLDAIACGRAFVASDKQ